MDRRLFIKGTGTIALTGAVGFSLNSPAHAQELDEAALLETGDLPDMILGDENAPNTIIEYASMTCPHCASFHKKTYPELKEKYIDTGEARFILREYPLDTSAMAAAMIARCAPENVYFEVVDLLLEKQEEWTEKEDVYNALLDLSRQIGFTQEKFDACLADQDLYEDINWIKNRGTSEFKVRSTPTLIINGEVHRGAISIDSFDRIFQSE